MKRGWLIPLAGAAAALVGCVGYGYPGSGYGAGDPNPGYGSGYPSSGGGYYPSAPGYGSTVRCESNDGRVRRCDANTRGGVRLSKQISNTRCVQGSNWGYDNSGIWVSQGCRAEFVTGTGGYNPGYGNPGYGNGQTIRCESNDGRVQHCGANTRGGVRLSKQISNTRCVQGSNWGYDNSGIWVSQGCRAEFVTGNGGYGSGQGNPGYGNGQLIRCESEDGRMRRCNVRVGRDVQVSRQLSNTRCIERRNWGWDRNGIWVNSGCRAEFRVY